MILDSKNSKWFYSVILVLVFILYHNKQDSNQHIITILALPFKVGFTVAHYFNNLLDTNELFSCV